MTMNSVRDVLKVLYAKDASGHEHKGKGRPDGGQFVASGQGGSQNEAMGKKAGKAGVVKPFWKMNHSEWVTSGMPGPPKGMEDTEEAERQAIIDFLDIFDDPSDAALAGQIEPDTKNYLPTRDESFAKTMGTGTTPLKSKQGMMPKLKRMGISNATPIEDARYAIWNGRKLGYRDKDIAAYLLWNYIPDGDRILQEQIHPRKTKAKHHFLSILTKGDSWG